MKNNEKTKEGRLGELQKLRTRFVELEASNAKLQTAQKTLLARLDMFRFNRMEQMLRESEEELAPSISITIPIQYPDDHHRQRRGVRPGGSGTS